MTTEGWSRDVTADIADELRRRYIETDELLASILAFLEATKRRWRQGRLSLRSSNNGRSVEPINCNPLGHDAKNLLLLQFAEHVEVRFEPNPEVAVLILQVHLFKKI